MIPALLSLALLPGQVAAQRTGVALYDKAMPWSSDVGPGVPGVLGSARL